MSAVLETKGIRPTSGANNLTIRDKVAPTETRHYLL